MRVLKFCDKLTSEAGGFCDKYSLGIDRFRFHDTIRVLARKTVLGWLGQLVDQLFRLKTNQVEFTTVYIRERERGWNRTSGHHALLAELVNTEKPRNDDSWSQSKRFDQVERGWCSSSRLQPTSVVVEKVKPNSTRFSIINRVDNVNWPP